MSAVFQLGEQLQHFTAPVFGQRVAHQFLHHRQVAHH
jgi:hypothetical protein